MTRRVLSVNTAVAQPLDIDGRRVMSAIGKRGVDGPRRVGMLGLEGDEQADPSVHGGLAKALYAYPHAHYAFWDTVRAQVGVAAWGDTLPYGALGENLTLTGLLESDVWVGDRLRFDDCMLAVSAPRFPCFKLNAALGFEQASRAMVAQGWCGFYLAVREPGTIVAGAAFELLPGPREVGISELFRARASA